MFGANILGAKCLRGRRLSVLLKMLGVKCVLAIVQCLASILGLKIAQFFFLHQIRSIAMWKSKTNFKKEKVLLKNIS